MADYSINRARLATAPMALPFNVPNLQTQILADGVVASAPLVALAYSFAVLSFEGNGTHSGKSITAESGNHSITITLDQDGKAELSLLPFIRVAVLTNTLLENPLYCQSGATFQQNNYRGYIDMTITEQGQQPIAMRIHYIFGNYAPRGEHVTDVWMDYDANGETWVNVDSAANYDANGHPVNFEDNWCNVAEILDFVPYGDFVLPLEVAWFYGGDDIYFSNVNYHFRFDCRTFNVIKVRWLDADGNINTRKFTLAGRNHGASVSQTWQLPHSHKEINLGYDRGRDQWANIEASGTITIGDDNIPIEQFEWLRSIVSTPVVEAFIGNVWVRCNVADSSVQADPRKSTFSITITLVVPTPDIQQF